MCRKSSGKNLINLPLRSILQRTQRLVVLITVPCSRRISPKAVVAHKFDPITRLKGIKCHLSVPPTTLNSPGFNPQ